MTGIGCQIIVTRAQGDTNSKLGIRGSLLHKCSLPLALPSRAGAWLKEIGENVLHLLNLIAQNVNSYLVSSYIHYLFGVSSMLLVIYPF